MDHGRGGFIDKTGTVVIPLCFDDVGEFSEGLARFERDGNWGYVDGAGAVVIGPVYPWAEDFHEGLAHVQVSGEAADYDGNNGVDKIGKVAHRPDLLQTMSDEDGMETVQRWLGDVEAERCVSSIGNRGSSTQLARSLFWQGFLHAHPFSEGLAAATESKAGDGGWGYIDRTGNWVIPPTFVEAGSFQSGFAPVQRNLDCEYIDKSGAFAVLHLSSTAGDGQPAARRGAILRRAGLASSLAGKYWSHGSDW